MELRLTRPFERPASPEDFADWVRPILPAMSRLAARLGPPGDRDDVVQEALTRAWAKRGQFDSARGTASSWLLAITADQARRARRRRLPFAIFDPGRRVRSIEDRLDIQFAVSRLPARQRLAVDCFYFVGLWVAETAAVMGCAEGTVKSTLSDARARLQQLLEPDP
jgi:RNA polymerase sigma factor (sigma-70 family)